jgi:hypothetical protein
MAADTTLILSAAAIFALWVATFWFASRRRTISKAVMFYLGLFLAWPASALSLGLMIADSAFQGIDKPVGGGVVLVFGSAFAVTLVVWLTGHAIASMAGWLVQKRVAFAGALTDRSRNTA